MLPEGTVLQQNRYRIDRILGQGGMGAVYEGWHLSLDTPVAIKEMVPQPGLEMQALEQLRTQFKREARTLARLSHGNLVHVMDSFEEDGNAYLVMEMVAGESLSDRIRREGALPQAMVLNWGQQLLDALAYCHGQGIIHRDIKPHNIIIRADERAVLVDFGLVKLWDPSDPRTKTAMRGMGTPEYAPPEQYDAEAGYTDARSDIYGLGATLYHALAGKAPPTATTRVVNPDSLIPIHVLVPNVTPAVEQALAQSMELRPIDRFQSAREMAAALRGQSITAPSMPMSVSQPITTPTMPEMPQTSVPLPSTQTGRSETIQLPEEQKKRGWYSIASLLLSIFSVLSLFIKPVCMPIVAVVGLILGFRGRKEQTRPHIATAGIVLCGLILAISLFVIIVSVLEGIAAG